MGFQPMTSGVSPQYSILGVRIPRYQSRSYSFLSYPALGYQVTNTCLRHKWSKPHQKDLCCSWEHEPPPRCYALLLSEYNRGFPT